MRHILNFMFLLTLASGLTSCDKLHANETAKENTKVEMVTIYGYNYTDSYIDGFSVNGQGGSDLAVSSPTAGGGKGACCVTVRPHQQFSSPVKIKWTRDRQQWCEVDVTLKDSAPAKPGYFEVHFYQDGHVEAAVTEDASEPRVKLDRFSRNQRHETGNVNNDAKYARCTNGK
jgi:hypothetical protein